MSDPCLPLEELLALTDCAAEDARWVHVRACPRCRSRLRAHDWICTHATGRPAPGEQEEVARILANLGARLELDMQAPVSAWTRRWRMPRHMLVPALGAAAMLAGVLILAKMDLPGLRRSGVQREATMGPRESLVRTAPVQVLPEGAIELRWHPVSGADSYRIRILDIRLREAALLEAQPETTRVIPREDLRALPEEAAFWQVEPLSGGDPIGESTPVGLPRRPHPGP